MRLAPKFSGNVGHCVVLPQVANSSLNSDELNVVWTGVRIWGDQGPDIEISVEGVKALAKLVGLPSRDDHTKTLAELETLRHRVSQLEEELREADLFQESAEWTLRHFGTRVQAKPGRKSTTAKAA